MFKSGFGNLILDGDHLDLTYRRPEEWPNLTPGGALKCMTFDIGDEAAGPSIQLGLSTPTDAEVLDWRHSIDPLHHHGSDQFRVISGGEWLFAGQRQAAGGYSFQEAGCIYQEHPGKGGAAWTALLMADRRGNESTLALERDRESFYFAGNADFSVHEQDGGYPHPAGSKGLAAVSTTRGPCINGYLRGRIEALAEPAGSGAMTGVLGDPTVGPVVHVIKAAANAVAVPGCTYPTEVFLIVVAGSVRIGQVEYVAGDMRLQRAGVPLGAVRSGPDGAEVTVIVADRRAHPVIADGETAADWPGLGDLAARARGQLAIKNGPQFATAARGGRPCWRLIHRSSATNWDVIEPHDTIGRQVPHRRSTRYPRA
jgi:hypothetical protein